VAQRIFSPFLYAIRASDKVILFAPRQVSGLLACTGSFSQLQTEQISYSSTYVFPQHGHFIFVEFIVPAPLLILWSKGTKTPS
jgi:hypothetical protein